MTGAWRSLALSLRQYADRLVDNDDFESAESVLHAMEMLAQLRHEGLPESGLVEGILAERRAVLFAERQDWSRAVEWFSKALDANPQHGRRELKVRGGMARAEWLAGGPTEEAIRAFRELVDASSAWTDVHEWAVKNLEAAQADDRSRAVPFDIS